MNLIKQTILNFFYNLKISDIFVGIFPIVSIFLIGNYYPADKQPYRPIFQPPNIVFPIIWTYISLVFGIVTILSLKKNNNCITIIYYLAILTCLLCWLPINYYKYYELGFWLLLITSYISVLYIIFLSITGIRQYIFLLPMPFWLIIATALNGVILDKYYSR